MTVEEDVNQMKAAFEKAGERYRKDPEAAREALRKLGVMKQSGRITKKYRGLFVSSGKSAAAVSS